MVPKKCINCNSDIPTGKKVCINCGKDYRNFFVKHKAFSVIIVVVLLAVIAGIGNSDKNTQNQDTQQVSSKAEDKVTTPIEYIAINIDALETELKNNAAVAKEKYEGKYLAITGRLGTIDASLKYISLLSITDKWDISGVHCTIKNEQQKTTVKTLKKDDTIVVKGKITSVGEVLGYYLDIDEITK